jgi:hypothetical protein
LTEPPETFARWFPSCIGLVAFVFFAILWLTGRHDAYFSALDTWGIVAFRFPFLDIGGGLSAWDCARQGIDIMAANPCDPLARPYNLSPFWITIDWIPLGLKDRGWFGCCVGATFFLSLGALPAAKSWPEMLLRLAATLSPMVVLAVERSNVDLWIFLFTITAVIAVLQRRPALHFLGYALIFLAGAIKYYPFILLALTAMGRLRQFVALLTASLFGVLVFFLFYERQIRQGLPNIPAALPFADWFGLMNLPVGLTAFADHWIGVPGGAVSLVVLGVLFALVAWRGIRLWELADLPAVLRRLDASCRLLMLAGALLICGCFLAGQSIEYRGIFLILLLPGLSRLAADGAAGAAGAAARRMLVVVPLLMWGQALRLWLHLAVIGGHPEPGFGGAWILDSVSDLILWFAREIAWWLLISFLVMIIFASFREALVSHLTELRLRWSAESGSSNRL